MGMSHVAHMKGYQSCAVCEAVQGHYNFAVATENNE